MHYASSASVYGTLEHFNEEGPFQPQSLYAYSKYLFDRHVKKYPASINYISIPDYLHLQYQAFTCGKLGRLNKLIDMKWTVIRDYIEMHIP